MTEEELQNLTQQYTEGSDYTSLENIYVQAAFKNGFKKALEVVYKHTEASERDCDGGRSGGRDDLLDNSYNYGLWSAIEPFYDLIPV